jgi:hypothetical protein
MKKLILALTLALGLGVAQVEAAPAVRSGSLAVYAATASSTSRTLTAGAGWAQNDVLFAVATGTNITSIVMPTGWTTVTGCGSSQGILFWTCGYIVRGASDPSLTWTIGSSASRYVEIFAIALTGVDTTTPVVNFSLGTGFNGNVTVLPDPPSVADCGTNSQVVIFGAKRTGPTDDTTDDLWVAPSGYTLLATNPSGCVVNGTNCGTTGAFAYSTSLLSSTQDPGAFSDGATGTVDGWHGITIAFKDAGGGGGGGGSVPPGLLLTGVGGE